MSIVSLFGQSVDIFHPKRTLDGFGDVRNGWSDIPDETVRGRAVAQVIRGRDNHSGRDLSEDRWKVYMEAPATGLDEKDRIRVQGVMLDIVAVYPVQHPRTGTHHMVAEAHTQNGTVNYGG